MAIKIRCSDCRKKISIDEAFSGGVCRCPYCTALVFVPADALRGPRPGRPAGPGGRPEAPGDRPAAPGDAAAKPSADQQAKDAIAAAEDEGAHVPVAAPVRLQGIATIVMLVVLLVLLCGGAYTVGTKSGFFGGKGGSDKNGDEQPANNAPKNQGAPKGKFNPFLGTGSLGGPGIDGMKIDSPIIYCIESGATMGDTLNYAVAMTRVSVRSLTGDHKFNVLLGEEGGQNTPWYRFILDDYNSGGEAGENAIKGPLDRIVGKWAPNVPKLIKAALAAEPKPHTIVFFAGKSIPEAEELGKLAKDQGVKIVTICLTEEAAIVASMAKLAEVSGGTSRYHSLGDLGRWASAADFE